MNKLVSEESGVFKCYLSAMCFRVSKINERATSVEQKSCKIRTNSNLKCLLQSPVDAIRKIFAYLPNFPARFAGAAFPVFPPLCTRAE